jgi:signal transduction histidine kinase
VTRTSARAQARGVVGVLLLAVGLLAGAGLLGGLAPLRDGASGALALALAGGGLLLVTLGVAVRLLLALGADEREADLPLSPAGARLPEALRPAGGRAEHVSAALEQAQKLAAIGELAASVAHEVKNPMVGLLGFAQLGRAAQSLTEARHFFALIEADTKRASAVLGNLLDFSRPAGPAMAPLDLNAVVEGAVALCRHHLAQLGVEVETGGGERVSTVVGSETQLRQVVLNLVLNAAQAVAASPSKRVTVTTVAAGEAVEVRVQDSGPGITPEVMARLFEPFFTTRPRGEGTGLGLAVSRRIVEAHRGTLGVEPGLGRGACFFVRLPAAAGRPAPR